LTKLIAAQGCEIELTPASTTPATVQIVEPPSTDVKAEGKGLYRGQLTIMIAGYQGGAVTTTGAGSGTIAGTAQSVKIDMMPAVLEGDSGTAVVTDASTGATQPVTLRVKSAGQNSVKGA
jgi:hypothetical protein